MHGEAVPAVVTALGGSPWETAVAGELASLSVVRRCEDLEDLLVTAATGAAEAAVLSAYLVGLDRDVLARLGTLGLAVVGACPAGDEHAQRCLRQLGVDHVYVGHAGPPVLADLVRAAVADRSAAPGPGFANPFAALPVPTPAPVVEPQRGRGRVVAVWGPAGSPGRTTLATGLASEVAVLGWPTLLVDADVYGGSVAPALGLPEESSDLATACRAANLGALDVPALQALARAVAPGLSVLTGIATAERWPELRPSAVEVVLSLARGLAAVTVVDCGFSLEQDEELSYDTLAPRRNGATLAVLAEADLVVVVGSADVLGLPRLVRAVAELSPAVPGVRTTVVANRLRDTAYPEGEVRARLRRLAGIEQVSFLPLDVAAADAGPLLHRSAPESALRQALAALAAQLVAAPAPRRRGLLRR